MKRVDRNHSEIVKGLRAIGATVRSTAAIGQGFGDIIVGFRGLNWIFEIKNGDQKPSARRLTEAERDFHSTWQGQVEVIESLEDALKAIGAR
jgi:hypothetical protein